MRYRNRPTFVRLPSGVFTANRVWLVPAVIAFNLIRVAGILADRTGWLANATTTTIRRTLVRHALENVGAPIPTVIRIDETVEAERLVQVGRPATETLLREPFLTAVLCVCWMT